MNDLQTVTHERVGETTPAHFRSVQEAGGCLCKKQLHSILRPHVTYNSRTINAFFTDDLLTRCGLSREEMKRIRVFPVEVNFVVVSHLKTNQLI